MAAYNKFTPAVENLLEGINAGTDSWAIKLGTAVNQAAGTFTEVANGNGYTTGGVALVIASATQAAGVYTLTFTTPAVPTWTASGAGFSVQYVILADTTAGVNVGYYDYGSSQAVAAGETFTVTLTNAFTVT
jgi:hypothetical protein